VVDIDLDTDAVIQLVSADSSTLPPESRPLSDTASDPGSTDEEPSLNLDALARDEYIVDVLDAVS
jgi:hypothetical protein